MKKKFKNSILVAALMCTVSYGYYFYQINLDNLSETRNNTSIGIEESNHEQESDLVDQGKNSTDVEDDKEQDNKQAEQEIIKLYANSAVLLDASSNRILYEKNSNKKMPMASTTKIMTLIVTLENANLDDVVTISSYAARMPDVQLNIRTGEKYKLKDLVYSLMLESHNDSAVAIAEHVGGTVEGFAGLMNKKAMEIGCANTYYITPNGLDATNDKGTHSTTAADLARIMSYCIKESPKKENFLKITRTSRHTFSDIKGSRSFACNNHNAFLNMMEGALSGKTGFTGNAGYCYVGALERDGKTFVVALLACGWPNNKGYKWVDTKKLMNYGLTNYEYREIFQQGKKFDPVLVVNGQSQIGQEAYVNIGMKLPKEESLKVLMRADENIKVVYEVPKELEAPIHSNTVVGNVKYYLQGEELKAYPVYTDGEVDKIDFKWCIKQVIKIFYSI